MAALAPSKVGTADPLDSKIYQYVDENLDPVSPGSDQAAFVFKPHDLAALKARRAELFGGDPDAEAKRVNEAGQKAALADAERRAAAAEAEAKVLRDQIADAGKAEKAAAKDKS